jgi:hypothetical protein
VVGAIAVTVGAATTLNVNWSAADVGDVPAGVVTVTSTVPVPIGLTAVIVVSFTTVTSVAGVVPKSTALAPVNAVPVIVTIVPPKFGPLVGAIAVTAGAAATLNVNWSAADVGEVPAGVVTVTFSVPVPAGLTAVTVVSFTTVTSVAGVVPKSTAVAPVNELPVIVTVVPPKLGPLVGLIAVTAGAAATNVN